MMEATPISIDYREPQEIAAQLALLVGAENVDYGAHLQYGDVVWDTEEGSYGIELKSVGDFLHSLWSKEKGERLETQLDGLRSSVDVPMLGIHGLMIPKSGKLMICREPQISGNREEYRARVVARTGFTTSSVDGFLWAIQYTEDGRDVRVVTRPTKEWMIEAIAEIYLHTLKEPTARRTFKHQLDKGGTGDVQVDMIASIPGVGEEKARKLLDKWGSVQNLFNSDVKEIVGSVNGIGKVLATRIKEAGCSVR